MTSLTRPIAGVMLFAAVTAAGPFGVDLGRAEEAPPSFIMQDTPRPVPALHFTDGQGVDQDLTRFAGKVALLNIWATWCLPCRSEMAALDRLQADLGGPAFEVVAVSVDRGGIDAVRKFYAGNGIAKLAMYNDPSGRAYATLGAFGLPVTLLINRRGDEIGRVVGAADWESATMVGFLRARIRSDASQGAGSN
jgi:thiol-disulfide isomerase/thioredoxin